MAISGHGTLIARAPAATPFVFTDIAEMKDVTLPSLMRNVFPAETQNLNIDTKAVGMLRRGQAKIDVNFLPQDGTHDHLTGLIKAITTEPPPFEGYRFTLPAPSNLVWLASGFVTNFELKAPVDGLFSGSFTLDFSGKMWIGGVLIG